MFTVYTTCDDIPSATRVGFVTVITNSGCALSLREKAHLHIGRGSSRRNRNHLTGGNRRSSGGSGSRSRHFSSGSFHGHSGRNSLSGRRSFHGFYRRSNVIYPNVSKRHFIHGIPRFTDLFTQNYVPVSDIFVYKW